MLPLNFWYAKIVWGLSLFLSDFKILFRLFLLTSLQPNNNLSRESSKTELCTAVKKEFNLASLNGSVVKFSTEKILVKLKSDDPLTRLFPLCAFQRNKKFELSFYNLNNL